MSQYCLLAVPSPPGGNLWRVESLEAASPPAAAPLLLAATFDDLGGKRMDLQINSNKSASATRCFNPERLDPMKKIGQGLTCRWGLRHCVVPNLPSLWIGVRRGPFCSWEARGLPGWPCASVTVVWVQLLAWHQCLWLGGEGKPHAVAPSNLARLWGRCTPPRAPSLFAW